MVLWLYHGLPLLSGHTGFPPWQYRAMGPEFARLPVRDAIQTLVDLTGLSWILVRRDRVPAPYFATWQSFAKASDAVHIEPAGGDDLLLGVLLRQRRGWETALAEDRRPDATALGTSLAVLDDDAVRGRVGVLAPSAVVTATQEPGLHGYRHRARHRHVHHPGADGHRRVSVAKRSSRTAWGASASSTRGAADSSANELIAARL